MFLFVFLTAAWNSNRGRKRDQGEREIGTRHVELRPWAEEKSGRKSDRMDRREVDESLDEEDGRRRAIQMGGDNKFEDFLF